MHGEPKRVGAGLLTPFTLVLALLSLAAIYFIGIRFSEGLSAVTNLNPGYPWGIWIVVDVVIGTALGCGGFAMALLVYVFNRGEYHPLMRPALLGGLFGYTLAGIAVIVDLGRFWQFYNLLLPGYINLTSVMFEIALCVILYIIVLWIEVAPAILERLGLARLRRGLERFMWLFIALGIVLPTMHQSSLGTALIPLGTKLSPLYQTAFLPLLFVVSALAMGYGVVVAEATVVSKGFRLPSEHRLLTRVGRVVGWIIVAWLALRWGDIFVREATSHAFAGDTTAFWFWVENVLALGAAAAFLSPGGQRSERLTLLGGLSLLAFGSLYRLNAHLIAYTPAVEGYSYFPSVPEILVTLGIIAFEILLYLTFIKVFPILHVPARGRAAAAA